MKVEFRFDSDKMRALKMYTEQKGVSLEEELVQAAEGLYQKHVPASVKAFIGHKVKTYRSRGSFIAAHSAEFDVVPMRGSV